jgi:hypothetical protein
VSHRSPALLWLTPGVSPAPRRLHPNRRCHYMPRLTAVAASRYLARSPLTARPTVSSRSYRPYNPSQASYDCFSLLLTKVVRLSSLLLFACYARSLIPCYARGLSSCFARGLVTLSLESRWRLAVVVLVRPRARLYGRVHPYSAFGGSAGSDSLYTRRQCPQRLLQCIVPLEFPLPSCTPVTRPLLPSVSPPLTRASNSFP